MIIAEYGKASLCCDVCDKIIGFKDFQGVLDFKNKEKWKFEKDGDTYIDICPDCQ